MPVTRPVVIPDEDVDDINKVLTWRTNRVNGERAAEGKPPLTEAQVFSTISLRMWKDAIGDRQQWRANRMRTNYEQATQETRESVDAVLNVTD